MYVNEITKKLVEKEVIVTNKTMFSTITEWLSENYKEDYGQILDILDYANRPMFEHSIKEDYNCVKILVNTGGCEGIYVDADIVYDNEKGQPLEYIHIGTFKTLQDGMEAYELMGKLSGMLTMAAEHYLFMNGDKIT